MTPRGACGRMGDWNWGIPEDGFGVSGVVEAFDEESDGVVIAEATDMTGDVDSLSGAVDGIFLGGTKTCVDVVEGSSVELTVILPSFVIVLCNMSLSRE